MLKQFSAINIKKNYLCVVAIDRDDNRGPTEQPTSVVKRETHLHIFVSFEIPSCFWQLYAKGQIKKNKNKCILCKDKFSWQKKLLNSLNMCRLLQMTSKIVNCIDKYKICLLVFRIWHIKTCSTIKQKKVTNMTQLCH